METKKKVILGVLVLGAAAFIFKDKLFPGTTGTTTKSGSGGSNSPYEGKVIQRQGDPGWGRVVDGELVYYPTDTSWWADGHEQPIVLTPAEFANLPISSTRSYLANGQLSA